MKLEYTVSTRISGQVIESIVSDSSSSTNRIFAHISKQIADTRDQHTREALIRMGWTPPPSSDDDLTNQAAMDQIDPAYYRGQDRAVEALCEKIMAILEGRDDGSGVSNPPWEPVRRKLLAIVADRDSAIQSASTYLFYKIGEVLDGRDNGIVLTPMPGWDELRDRLKKLINKKQLLSGTPRMTPAGYELVNPPGLLPYDAMEFLVANGVAIARFIYNHRAVAELSMSISPGDTLSIKDMKGQLEVTFAS